MALEDILAAIREEAEAEEGRILDEARRRAGAVLDEARREAAAEAERLGHGRDAVAEVAARRITSKAHLEAERARRTAREAVYTEALSRTAAELARSRARPDYEEVLGHLIDEALAALPDAPVAITDPADAAVARRLIEARHASTEVKSGDVPWGGIVLSSDGRTVHNDLQSRMRRADDHLRYIAADIFRPLRGGGT